MRTLRVFLARSRPVMPSSRRASCGVAEKLQRVKKKQHRRCSVSLLDPFGLGDPELPQMHVCSVVAGIRIRRTVLIPRILQRL